MEMSAEDGLQQNGWIRRPRQEETGLHLNGIDCMAQMGIMYTAPTARIQQEESGNAYPERQHPFALPALRKKSMSELCRIRR